MRMKRLIGAPGIWKAVKAVPESLEGDIQNVFRTGGESGTSTYAIIIPDNEKRYFPSVKHALRKVHQASWRAESCRSVGDGNALPLSISEGESTSADIVIICIRLSGGIASSVPQEGSEDVPGGDGVCRLFDVSVSVDAMRS